MNPDLIASLSDALDAVVFGHENGWIHPPEHTSGLELLGLDEDQAIALHGVDANELLCAPIEIEVETKQICCVGPTCPGDWVTFGSVSIERADHQLPVVVRFDNQDGWLDLPAELFA